MQTGVGLGLRFELFDELLEALDRGEPLGIDLFEIGPENYMRRGGFVPAALARVAERFPIVTHGLTMGFGNLDPDPEGYVQTLRGFLREVGAPFHSDHLCFTARRGRLLHDLLPLPFLDEAVEHAAARLVRLREELDLPLALENVTYYARPGRGELDEASFLRGVLERADASLLLDVNNVFVNAQNFGFDARAFLDQLPLERVVQIHVAGHTHVPRLGRVVDTHAASVRPEVLALLEHAVGRTGPVPVILERDHQHPPLSVLIDEIATVRTAYERGLARHVASAQPRRDAVPEVHRVRAVGARLASLVDAVVHAVTAPSKEAQAGEATLSPDDQASLDADRGGLDAYRSLLHEGLLGAVRAQMPRAVARIGVGPVSEAVQSLLAAGGLRSPYLRDAARELLDHATPRWLASGAASPLVLELAEHELAAFAARAAPDAPAEDAAPLDLERPVRLAPSVALRRHTHPVHELADDVASIGPRPTALLAYRDAAHEARFLALSPLAADLVERLLEGATLRAALTTSAAGHGATLDAEQLAATSRLLADLAERGILLGAAPSAPATRATPPAPMETR